MSRYAPVDEEILFWAKRHGLNIFTNYKDSEVRSVDFFGSSGRKYQIWISPPVNGSVEVHVWDYGDRRRDWNVHVGDLAASLEEAVRVAVDWDSG